MYKLMKSDGMSQTRRKKVKGREKSHPFKRNFMIGFNEWTAIFYRASYKYKKRNENHNSRFSSSKMKICKKK